MRQAGARAGAGRRRQARGGKERHGRAHGVLGQLGGRRAHGRARQASGLGARAGQGCALGALRLVFNPVFRLGIFP